MKCLSICLMIMIIIFLSCCKKSTGPIGKENGPDTTSHEFSWQIDSIGIVGSYFNDIVIIDENDILAVGDLDLEDTTSGNRIEPYNAAQWDGTAWSFLKTYPSSGTYHANISVFAFNSSDIWTSFTAPYHWNGSFWIGYDTNGIHDAYTYGIWGTSSSNVFIVGTDGRITRFNGSQWTAMESGTDIKLRDIYGNGDHVFAVGYNDDGRSVVLELRNGQWQKIFSSVSYYGDLSQNDYGRTTAVSVHGDIAYIISKAGIIKYNYKSKKIKLIKAEDALITRHDYIRICVNSGNDILLIGLGGYIVHYNGKTWKKFTYFPDVFGYGNVRFVSGHFKDNVVVACGNYDGFAQGVVVRGYRTQN